MVFIFGYPGSSPVEKFIKNEAQSPNIAFRCIRLSLKNLNWHIQRCSDYCFVFEVLIGYFLCKSEISNFEDSILNHYIGRLEISMHDTLSYEDQKSIYDLSEHIYRLFFWELFTRFHKARYISITKLLNNIIVFATLHDIYKPDDVRVFYRFHDFYLLKKSPLQILVRVDLE